MSADDQLSPDTSGAGVDPLLPRRDDRDIDRGDIGRGGAGRGDVDPVSTGEHAVQRRLRDRTAQHEAEGWQVTSSGTTRVRADVAAPLIERDDARLILPRRRPAIPEEVLDREAELLARHIDADATPVGELRRRKRSVWRRAVQVGAILFALAVGYYSFTLWQVWSAGRSEQAQPVDAIVVMGAAQYDGTPSPQLAARLDHVVELWPQGHAPIVVVTGGNQPGDRFTEASASAEYLIDRGVPADAILMEDQGSTSFESLDRVGQMVSGSVVIVTDPYHSYRSKLIAEEVGLEAYVSPTGTSVVTGANSLERHIWEAGGVAVGRFTGFDWLNRATD